LLRASLDQRLAGLPIPRGGDQLETSERLLRIAAGGERRYWPNFALGRTLFFEGKYAEAELAFGACATLRPDYARSYEQRALMRAHQAAALSENASDAAHREKLQELAREDSARALSLARRERDPSTWWPKGDLHALLGEPAEALAAYTFALEWEDDIRQKVNRRNNIAAATRLAQSVIDDASATPQLRADAHAMVALGLLAAGDSADAPARAAEQAGLALALEADHPHALTARGVLAVRAAAPVADDLRRAVSDFTNALAGAPSNFLAAESRARAQEALDDNVAALAAWSRLLKAISPPSNNAASATWPLSDAQLARAHLGRARALRQLNRPDESATALSAAQRLDSSASLP
jgi:hypothetical protein